MANYAAAKKAIRQSKKRQIRNRSAKGAMRTKLRVLQEELAKKSPKKEDLTKLFNEVQSTLMATASKGIIPKFRASRTISRLSQRIQKVSK